MSIRRAVARVYHFAGRADREEIAKTLVEDDLRTKTGIREMGSSRACKTSHCCFPGNEIHNT
jgi:hypothetical protein